MIFLHLAKSSKWSAFVENLLIETSLKTPNLFLNGYSLEGFSIPADLREKVALEDWNGVDSAFRNLSKPGGAFFQFLENYYEFSSIEFILSIRDAENEWEEDGIWHDDGSRVFAFSLSITAKANEIEGGHLEIRKKESEILLASIPTPSFGTAILFLTGLHGFEHRTRGVKKGKRIIIAGWCSSRCNNSSHRQG